MKFTAILFLSACLTASATGFSQITLSESNAPLQKVFKEIQKQSGYDFICTYEMLEKAGRISVNVKNVSLQAALEACLKEKGLTFEFQEKTIVIKPAPNPEGGIETSFPPIDVHGHVTDSAGAPLAGASVTVKGNKGALAVTDANGDFTISGIGGDAVLLISSVGYETQEVKLKGRADVPIRLKRRSVTLLDVVVNKGYYSTSQRLNTGNVTKVSGEEIAQQPVSDPILALIGRVPGLNIQQSSGVPGAYATIQIRGQNSLMNGNDPLYMVDGVPFGSISLTSMDIGGGILGQPTTNISNVNGSGAGGVGMSPFNSLNPGDIESIEVLKDADATSIYGSRGANGVILITTKKGKPGKTRGDISVNTGAGQITRTLPLLNRQQYLAMRYEAFKNDGISPGPLDHDLNGDWDSTRSTNWQKTLIENTSSFTNAQASVSGGNANTQFLLSGNYNTQGVIFPGNYADRRATGHFSLTTASLDGKFHLQFSTEYANDNSDMPKSSPVGNIILPPMAPALHDQFGNLNWQLVGGTNTWNNPLAYTLQHATAITNNLLSSLGLDYEIFPGLRLESKFGYNYDEMNQTIQTPAIYYAPPFNTDPDYRTNLLATSNTKSWNIDPQLNYRRKMREGQLDILVGATFQQKVFHSMSQKAEGFASDALIPDPLAATTQILLGNYDNLYRYNAVFGRIGYNWKEKYLLNITMRRDGSSRFGSGKQFGNFGATGAGWIFSQENFMKNRLTFLSFGKLRASYGTTGNDQIGDYLFMSAYTPSGQTYQGGAGVFPIGLSNSQLAWEVKKELEGGLDLGFLKDKIIFSASYDLKRCGNQLVFYTLPSVTGYNYVEANFPATVQNTGWELSLHATNVSTGRFTWTTAFNLTLPQNKLVSFPGIEYTSYQYVYSVGKPLSIRYLYHYTGVDPQTGIYSFAAKDGSGIPSNPQDLIVSPPITQKYYGNFQNELRYKNLELNIVFQFVKQLGYSYQTGFSQSPGLLFNAPTYILSHWKKPGDISSVQRMWAGETGSEVGSAYNNLLNSDGVITDASFIRLKTLYLSYRLPGSLQQKMHLQNAKVYLSCQNLLTISGYKGLDPETQGSYVPPLRVVTAGLQLAL